MWNLILRCLQLTLQIQQANEGSDPSALDSYLAGQHGGQCQKQNQMPSEFVHCAILPLRG